MGGNETTIRVFIKGDYFRVETSNNGGKPTASQIIRLDKNLIWMLDYQKKEYTETRLPVQLDLNDSPITLPEIKVERTGEKKIILKKKCEKIVVAMKVTTQEGFVTFIQTMWISDSMPGDSEITEFNKKLIAKGGIQPDSNITGVNQKYYCEFEKKIKSLICLPLEYDFEMTISSGSRKISIKSHSSVTKIEEVPVSAMVFELPPGYVPGKME